MHLKKVVQDKDKMIEANEDRYSYKLANNIGEIVYLQNEIYNTKQKQLEVPKLQKDISQLKEKCQMLELENT